MSVRFQSLRRGHSQMSFLGLAHSLCVSYLPRPRVVPTRVQAWYTVPVKRGDECLHQHRRDPVEVVPVLGQLAPHLGEDVRGEVVTQGMIR